MTSMIFQITAVGDYLKDSFDQAEAILLEQQKEFYDWYDGRGFDPEDSGNPGGRGD